MRSASSAICRCGRTRCRSGCAARFFRIGPLVRRRAAHAHAARIVEAFDVRGGGLDAPARALSGGNMQKLILGRALLQPADAWSTATAPRSTSASDHAQSANRATAAASAGASAPGAPLRSAPSTLRLIVAHQPTWGLDIGAVAYVQQQLIAARDAGAAVLLISDDLDEVLLLGDRVAVMHGGRLGAPQRAEDWTREAIGLAMAGVAAAGGAAA